MASRHVWCAVAALGVCASGALGVLDVETRWVVELTDVNGQMMGTGGADDVTPDVLIAPGRVTGRVRLQARTFAPEGWGMATVSGLSLAIDLLPTQVTSVSTGLVVLDTNGPANELLFRASTGLQVLANTTAGPAPGAGAPARGQGVFRDVLLLDFAFFAQEGEDYTFRYDPSTTLDGAPSATIIDGWVRQPGPEVVPGLSIFAATTRDAMAGASALTLRAVPAPAWGGVALLGAWCAARRRRD